MTTPTGHALKMKMELRALAQKHNVVVQRPSAPLPMSAATSCSQLLSGFASTGDVDHERMKFRGFAFGLLRKRTPLLFRHDPNVVAGEIEKLSYDEHGNLQIRCRVDHPEARRCNAFSVSGRIREYRLHNTDSEDF